MTAVPSIRSLGVFRGVLGTVVGQHARAMNAVTADVCATRPRVDYVELPLLPRERERYRSTRGYAVWAAGMAATMAPRLPAGNRTVSALDEHDAARLLELSSGVVRERVEGLLRAAAGIAGTRFAAFSVAVGDRVHGISLIGGSRFETPYAGSFTEATVLSRDGIRIPDARLDDRFAHGALVTGEPYLRFFAAHPVHSARGSRIGGLSVFDTEPDEGRRFETAHLRDFAKRLQRELRGLEPPQSPR